MTAKVIYRAEVSNKANNDKKFYFGLAETTFMEHYSYHKRDVKHIKCHNNIESTKYIWNLKNNIEYNIQWKNVDKVYGNATSAMHKLCLTEKLRIINHINDNNIDLRQEGGTY